MLNKMGVNGGESAKPMTMAMTIAMTLPTTYIEGEEAGASCICKRENQLRKNKGAQQKEGRRAAAKCRLMSSHFHAHTIHKPPMDNCNCNCNKDTCKQFRLSSTLFLPGFNYTKRKLYPHFPTPSPTTFLIPYVTPSRKDTSLNIASEQR